MIIIHIAILVVIEIFYEFLSIFIFGDISIDTHLCRWYQLVYQIL